MRGRFPSIHRNKCLGSSPWGAPELSPALVPGFAVSPLRGWRNRAIHFLRPSGLRHRLASPVQADRSSAVARGHCNSGFASSWRLRGSLSFQNSPFRQQ